MESEGALRPLPHTMIAGNSPFTSDGARSVLAAHVFDVPPPLSKEAAQPVPPLLDIAVARALSKRADERYPHAREMATVLERVLEKLPASDSGLAPIEPGGAAAASARAQFGTLLLRPTAGSHTPNADKAPEADAICLHAGPASPMGRLARRLVSAYQRLPLAARVAAGSSLLFFVLLWLSSRLLLGTR